ncbi:AEL259Wp [Eremothecium gossypii ATCC 10895]|uniref:phosphoadenylyl-sulfate reductase (thioredoxin) n=1 Tax=Eremothecium gossypii (strain ATCC 10895 / CBS 109.51 / FGSC 9923 / NRRL Y-1056) TaxID=284811 RepID=Q758M0_EREGS|nr:AEL259Wp [Eremothecium gossypii ATCC 10895]AAS52426.1 AEL259Wp [Eremothecium gossypii ATCC 10895]AEY96724.1 FAEL259Wp [Eremothecium gossypii FDAG1]
MLRNNKYELNDGLVVTDSQLDCWNMTAAKLTSPAEVLHWAVTTFPHLYQMTAFGLTGLATIDMLSKLPALEEQMVPLIFIDTLHLFPQTLSLLHQVEDRYYKPLSQSIHIFRPAGVSTEKEFAEKYGSCLWETDEDKYDFIAKVEPAHRAFRSLGVGAVLTGRRRSQGGSREQLNFVEVDEVNAVLKINPFVTWSFDQVWSYILDNRIPYNELLNYGYKSIGDYHSTLPVVDGAGERSGRWKGKAKTECGLHTASKYARYLLEQK